MMPSKIKIESFAKLCHMGTLGGKGLKKSHFLVCDTSNNELATVVYYLDHIIRTLLLLLITC